jgi:hypothetical protein
MSHIVTIQTNVHDPHAVAAACQRLNLAATVQGTARLYSGDAEGLVVRFPGWQYPAAIDHRLRPLRQLQQRVTSFARNRSL